MPSISQSLPIALLVLLLTACGGGSSTSSEPPVGNQLLTNQQVSGFPHAVDIYVPANPARVVVFLHGGGGSKESFAYNMGINLVRDSVSSSSVNWQWLTDNGMVAVVPQGQGLDGRGPPTWSNYVMSSGQDDVAFLRALVAKIRADYGNVPVSVVGHSNGAMMVNRMWCESAETFSVHVAFAGPGSQHFARAGCAPSRFRPYLGFVGDNDTTIGAAGAWTAPIWTLRFENGLTVLDPDLVGEWVQYGTRTLAVCGEARTLADGVVSGSETTWDACGGRLRVQLAAGQGHDLGAPSVVDPTILSRRGIAFIRAHEAD